MYSGLRLILASLFLMASSFSLADEQLMRKEVARFFELTSAINPAPVKKRLGELISRKLRQNNSGLQAIHFQTVESVVSQEVNKLHSEQYFFEQYYQVYSKHYTYEELRAINDFFASDVGKKFIGIRGALHQDVSKASIKMIHRLVDQFSPKVKVSLAKSGYEVEL